MLRNVFAMSFILEQVSKPCVLIRKRFHRGPALAANAVLQLVLLSWSIHCFAQPVCVDNRLTISLFAEAPNIVQPVSALFDSKGRLLVIENHTHFRPDDYVGPAHDRILAIEDKNGDGKADSFDVFYDGQSDSMDLARHSDGSNYLATRRAIFRLEDNDHDGRAETTKKLVTLETDGNYPHNGLSGLVFDSDGNLQFGFGENLGKNYALIGSDGSRLAGGAEGGSTYRCSPNGEKLERVATGFWNPFGQCMDAFGNIFAVDNDPDAAPPCRLLHVTEGANFGYQFKYGRPGTHPLQTWTGELPGTIGMVAGTGEAPCEIIHYDQNGLPEDYLGDLLVASWGDHRIERFRLKRKGASFEATRTIIVQGDTSFWPVGIAVAPDGSLYVTDWGSRSYPLHGEGKVWHVAAKAGSVATEKNKRWNETNHAKVASIGKMRASGLDGLRKLANESDSVDVRASAVKRLGQLGSPVNAYTSNKNDDAVRYQALQYFRADDSDSDIFVDGLESDDAVLRSSAVAALARNRKRLVGDWFTAKYFQQPSTDDASLRVGVALACELSNADELKPLIPAMLQSKIAQVRLVAARWAADRELKEFLPNLAASIKDGPEDFRVLLGLIAAKRHLEGGTLNNDELSKAIVSLLNDPRTSSTTKTIALRAAAPDTLPLESVAESLRATDISQAREAVYLLMGDKDPAAKQLLEGIVEDDKVDALLRADALVALSKTELNKERLLKFSSHDSVDLRRTAMRLLTSASMEQPERAMFSKSVQAFASGRDIAIGQRVLATSANSKRTVDELMESVRNNVGDKDRGRRLFHNTRLVQCANCHVVANRGASVGPQLTGIGKAQTREQMLESIVNPSSRIAPQYQPWVIVDKEGRARTGYHLASVRLVETFVDPNGKQFKIAQDDIEERVATDVSIMPTGLIDHLTDQEIADLLAFLGE